MVSRNEIIDIGFMPYFEYTKNDHSFVINNKVENSFVDWQELIIMYNFKNCDCEIYFSDSSKKQYKKQVWRGKISSINELEEKLQDLYEKY